MKHFSGSILLKCTSELVNMSVLTILVAETNKITKSRANMFETCVVCTSRNDTLCKTLRKARENGTLMSAIF